MKQLVQTLLPQRCLGCGRTCADGVCSRCLDQAEPANDVIKGDSFDFARFAFAYSGVVKQAVLRLKYRAEHQLAGALAQRLAPLMADNVPITWVPASASRVRSRGIDHCRLLALAVSSITGAGAIELLQRRGDPPPQVTLSPARRILSPCGTIEPIMPSPAAVCLIDDVFTTGATINEAARACRKAGASEVHAACLAYSRPQISPFRTG